MIHLQNLLLAEPRQRPPNPLPQQLPTLLIRISHHETIHMHQRHLLRLKVIGVVRKHVQELYRVHRQVHVNVVGGLEVDAQGGFLSVELSHDLSRAHVRADHVLGHLVQLGVVHQVLVAVRVEVVGDHIETLLRGSYG